MIELWVSAHLENKTLDLLFHLKKYISSRVIASSTKINALTLYLLSLQNVCTFFTDIQDDKFSISNVRYAQY